MRELAKSLFKAAVEAADPVSAVRRELKKNPLPELAEGRYIVIAVGKAACPMMEEALRHIPASTRVSSLVVTNYENARDIAECNVMASGHPVPDANGILAGDAAAKLALMAGEDDRVLCLISGGGSALLPAPVPGLKLSDKVAVNKILLSQGVGIKDMNLVRQQLSLLKGGGLARLSHPAPVRSLIISDVIGDDISAIASGPTAAPLGGKSDAKMKLQELKIWYLFPENIQALLSEEDESAALDIKVENVLIGTNRKSLEAIRDAAPDWNPRIATDRLEGDVAQAASKILSEVRKSTAERPELLIFGGETTVKIQGDGKGGRNQELALRIAMMAGEGPGEWVFLSGGTDGRDGPTDVAGGLVDAGTADRIREQGLNPADFLNNNDSYHALEAAGDLLKIGATGTNVADVQIFLRGFVRGNSVVKGIVAI